MPQSYSYRSRASYSSNHRSSSNKSSRKPKKDYIHPSKFVQSAQPQLESAYNPKHSFQDFVLNPLLMRNLTEMGYSNPTPIQDQAIPSGLDGRDIVGIANTGTGKTAAFAIPLLNRLMSDPRSKALIMAPTRELAQQIEQQCRILAKGSGLGGALLIGGTAMGPQLRDLRSNPKIVIGTPGRIKDHLERRSLNASGFNLAVLDEVDRMLDMGFVHDITHILSHLSPDRQSFYFSATVDAKVKAVIERFSSDPVTVTIESTQSSGNVEQDVINYSSNDNKIDKLHDILISKSTAKVIVFDDTHRSVEKLSKELASRGFSTDAIHGGRSQSQRRRVLNKFIANEITVLVATDVAARGLDVSDVTHVINYSQPQSYDDYIHRIGRTGRAGKVGYALTFVEA